MTITKEGDIVLLSAELGEDILAISTNTGPDPALSTSGNELVSTRADEGVDLWDLSKVPMAAELEKLLATISNPTNDSGALYRRFIEQLLLGTNDSGTVLKRDPQIIRQFIEQLLSTLDRPLTPDQCKQYVEVATCVTKPAILNQLNDGK